MSAAFAAPIPPVQGHPEPAHKVRSLRSPDQSVSKPSHPAAARKTAKPLAKAKPAVKPSVKAKPGAKKVLAKPIAHPLWSKPAAHKPAFAKPLAGKPAPKKPLLAKPKVAVKVGPPAFEKKTIQAKYDAMSLLVMRRDGNRLASLLLGMTTPDFVYRDKKGRPQNRAKLVGDLKRQLKAVRSFKRSGNRVAGFAMKGAVGTAQVVSDFAMVFPNGPKSVTVAGQSTTQDTWIKTPAGWKLKSIRTLRESVKYNGKAV